MTDVIIDIERQINIIDREIHALTISTYNIEHVESVTAQLLLARSNAFIALATILVKNEF